MLYHMHELNRSLLNPLISWSGAASRLLSQQNSWLGKMPGAQPAAANYELIYRLGKDYEKPQFGIDSVRVRDRDVLVHEERAVRKPFCDLLHFRRSSDNDAALRRMAEDPTVLVVAPLSGHHSTLLREAVRTLLADHNVYITDWIDARTVPGNAGSFGLDDYVDHVGEFMEHIGIERLHVLAVCQPTVPVLAAISLRADAGKPTPRSMTLMGGPIDTRKSPTKVNELATTRDLSWFEDNVIFTVPGRYEGSGRRVYPGFLQHAGFVAMNPNRHFSAHRDFYNHLVGGGMEGAESHRRFYDEYNAVLDMPAEYYLDTIRVVFQDFLLPRGKWDIHGQLVRPQAITDTALLTVEGELDDISGPGQTDAAHALCSAIPANRRDHLSVSGAGHYGIFSGRRWRSQVYQHMRAFIARHD